MKTVNNEQSAVSSKGNLKVKHENDKINFRIKTFLASHFSLLIALFIVHCSLLVSCNDPVFFAMSQEVKQPPPAIPGSPTDYVEIDGYVYVGSGTSIFTYDIKKAEEKRFCGECNSEREYWHTSCRNCRARLEKIQPWSEKKFAFGRITNLVSVNKNIYILTRTNNNSNIYKGIISSSVDTEPDIVFDTTPITDDDYIFLSMYCAGPADAKDQIFLGAIKKIDYEYSVFRLTGTSLDMITLPEIKNRDNIAINTSQQLLNGVAYDKNYYYLSVKDQITEPGGAIYKITNGSNEAETITIDTDSFIDESYRNRVTNDYGIPFMGIIDIDNTNVIAIDRRGRIYQVTSSSLTTYKLKRKANETEYEIELSTGRLSNGVLYVTKALDGNKLSGTDRMLLAGRQDSLNTGFNTKFTYGYLEIPLSGNNIDTDYQNSTFLEPGRAGISSPSTLPRESGSNERFRTTIGTYPIKHFYLTSNNVLFASTHNSGIWVIRDWGDKRPSPYWNVEN